MLKSQIRSLRSFLRAGDVYSVPTHLLEHALECNLQYLKLLCHNIRNDTKRDFTAYVHELAVQLDKSGPWIKGLHQNAYLILAERQLLFKFLGYTVL